MAYATYDDYLLLYGGTCLIAESFQSAVGEASAEVDHYVFGRLSAGAEVTDEIKKAVCAAAEAVYDRQAATARGSVSSENVDGYSVWGLSSARNLSTEAHLPNPLIVHSFRQCWNMSKKTPIA